MTFNLTFRGARGCRGEGNRICTAEMGQILHTGTLNFQLLLRHFITIPYRNRIEIMKVKLITNKFTVWMTC